MITRKLFVAAAVATVLTLPAMAQKATKETENGHHYSGGPKTEVPHHMGKKETTGKTTSGQSGGHHYNGGPGTSTPHHMGDKKSN